MNKSELFTLANQLRKELHLSQKDAYAMAKSRLSAAVVPFANKTMYQELEEKLKAGVVKFTHKNKAGKEITTVGTLVETRIHSRIGGDMSKIPGRREPKSEEYAVYFDIAHGFYRPVIKDNIIKIW